jgi:molecular chaperone GrpE (heat shock protein)
MHDTSAPKLAKWPFAASIILLLGSVGLLLSRHQTAAGPWPVFLAVGCVMLSALLGVAPFLLEYRAKARLAEVGELGALVSQIQKIESLATQIASATAQWQDVQKEAAKTAGSAGEIAERMSAEAKAFTEFMQRANDNEKATLRLEVDKLHRAEGEWLQILVRMLDNVYALHQGGLQSGQPRLIEQLTLFQNACRDAARRVGLTPFVAAAAEPFDAQRHHLLDGNGQPPEGALVDQTLATGYTFQGRLLRPALVNLQNGTKEPAELANDGKAEGALEPA